MKDSRQDKQIILNMLKKENSLKYISDFVQEDKELMREIISYNATNYIYLNKENQNDIDLILHTLKKDFNMYNKIPKKFLSDENFIKQLSKIDRRTLDIASFNLKDNFDVVIEAVKNFGSSIMYASKNLQNNKEVQRIAIKSNPDSLKFINTNIHS